MRKQNNVPQTEGAWPPLQPQLRGLAAGESGAHGDSLVPVPAAARVESDRGPGHAREP